MRNVLLGLGTQCGSELILSAFNQKPEGRIPYGITFNHFLIFELSLAFTPGGMMVMQEVFQFKPAGQPGSFCGAFSSSPYFVQALSFFILPANICFRLTGDY